MKNKIFKLRRAYKRFGKHPITQGNQLYSFLRYYVWFNISVLFTKEIEYKWLGNLKLKIRKGDAGLVGNYYYGLLEFEESLLLLHYTRKTDIFLDVGANLGHYSLLLSGLKKCKSIAIEPVPNTFERLRGQIRNNRLEEFITALNKGVSNEKGELHFSTDKGTMNKIVSENYVKKQLVAVDCIDSICENEPINILKIDAEGYEKFILEGAHKVLRSENLDILLLEINNSGKHYNISDEVIYNKVIGYGFVPCVYDINNRDIKELEGINRHSFNTIFIKNKERVISRIKSDESIEIRNQSF